MSASVNLGAAELQSFVADLADSPALWRGLVRPSDHSRVYERIWDDAQVNAWVICWSEGQDTGFHDHDESAAALAVVQGQVREDRLRLGAPPAGQILSAGANVHIPATAIHRVGHAGRGPAVSIHAYSPPLQRTGAYIVRADGSLERMAQSYTRELRAEPVSELAGARVS